MPIAVTCTCGKRFDVPDSYAGRTGNCTACGAPLAVPGNDSASAIDIHASDDQIESFQPRNPLPAPPPPPPMMPGTPLGRPQVPQAAGTARYARGQLQQRGMPVQQGAPATPAPAAATVPGPPPAIPGGAAPQPTQGAWPVAPPQPPQPAGSGGGVVLNSPPKEAVTIGRNLGKYELVRKLGDPKSKVFLANSPEGQVTVKVLPQVLVARSETAGKRFLREARSMFKLRHPNLIMLLDAGEELGSFFLAMEYFVGKTLQEMLDERGGTLPEQLTLEIAIKAARGARYLGENHLVHRNIKPDHIMVDDFGTVKLVGMGLVRESEGDDEMGLTVKGTVVGTPQYMSPEQAQSGDLDVRSDLYSLGITIFRCLAGETPFEDKVFGRLIQMVTRQPAPSLKEKNPAASDAIATVVAKLLQKKPSDRYQEASDLIEDLEAIRDGKLVNGLPPTLAAEPTKPGTRAKPVSSRRFRPKTGIVGIPTETQALQKKVKVLTILVIVLVLLVVALLAVVVVTQMGLLKGG